MTGARGFCVVSSRRAGDGSGSRRCTFVSYLTNGISYVLSLRVPTPKVGAWLITGEAKGADS